MSPGAAHRITISQKTLVSVNPCIRNPWSKYHWLSSLLVDRAPSSTAMVSMATITTPNNQYRLQLPPGLDSTRFHTRQIGPFRYADLFRQPRKMARSVLGGWLAPLIFEYLVFQLHTQYKMIFVEIPAFFVHVYLDSRSLSKKYRYDKFVCIGWLSYR